MKNKNNIALVIGIMCLILTYGIVVQVRTVERTGTTVSTSAKENELRDSVLKLKEKYDNLYNQLEEAEKQLEIQRNNATKNNGELEKIEESIKEGNKSLGLTEVTGSGVIVRLNDNQKISANMWFADPKLLIVHDTDIIRVVNELKNAGAEAISINEQRIISTSAIECDGNVVKVNGVKIGAPFEIKAIGFQEMLMGLNRFGGYLDYLREDRYLEVTIKKEDDIIIPKYTGVIKYDYIKSE